jgi:hypothetical protein
MTMGHWWNDTDREKPQKSEEICLCADLCTTDLIWSGLCLNPGFHVERPVTKHLKHGMAMFFILLHLIHVYLAQFFFFFISSMIFN